MSKKRRGFVEESTMQNSVANNTTEKEFIREITNAPLYRKYCDNLDGKHFNIICFLKDLDFVISFCQKYNNYLIEKIYLISSEPCMIKEVEIYSLSGIVSVPVTNLSEIQLEVCKYGFFVFLNSKEFYDIYLISCFLISYGISTFEYYSPFFPIKDMHCKSNVKFLDENFNNLYFSYNLLEDEGSKNTFISRIKAILSGDSGYLKSSFASEYYNNFVYPKVFDTIIDAGVSASIATIESFCCSIGPSGKIYSFEPEPGCYESAKKALERSQVVKNGQCVLIKCGLWDCHDTIDISANGAGSSLIYLDDDSNSSKCEVIKLDDFVYNNKIEKIDYIKMDVECSELKALNGAINTIKLFKPRLAISVYHCDNHLFEIVLFLNSLKLGYKFYMEHHSLYMYETVLYARPDDQ